MDVEDLGSDCTGYDLKCTTEFVALYCCIAELASIKNLKHICTGTHVHASYIQTHVHVGSQLIHVFVKY